MSSSATAVSSPRLRVDYGLTGANSALAIENGLAEADWYQCAVPRETLRSLLERRDGPALRDTLLWFALIFAWGYAAWALRHAVWFILPYALYCVLYASTSDSRWHESGHGTAFKTDWMNSVLYEIASFMVMRESKVWRWSHVRHHSDTIIVGRDPEIAVPRPPDVKAIVMAFFDLHVYPKYFPRILLHCFGRMAPEEKVFIPEQEFRGVFRRARVYAAIYAAVIALSIYTRSIVPLLFVGLPNLFGSWLLVTYGLTQHAGLAENVLDHRLNCRTVYMNRVNRFLYWNMNYHVEHHMFPLVPYRALPRLHAAIKDDCPAPYPSLFAAWRELAPAIFRQVKDPAYHVKRKLPEPSTPRGAAVRSSHAEPDAEGWIEVCSSAALGRNEVLRFDHGRKTFALYQDAEGCLHATDGFCTHGNTHLSEGLIVGDMIECAKHNGRFHLADGSPARAPVCRGLATYPLVKRSGSLHINIARPGGAGHRNPHTYRFRVLSNRSVATFIRELIVEPVDQGGTVAFIPGDYLQIDIPAYHAIRFRDFDIPAPYRVVWERQHIFDLVATNPAEGRRNNYSLASNQATDRTLRFNVRIATPPPGQDCAPGVGSSYVFSLKPGDIVTGIGPFGDFHVKETQREMVYIGGGAGMAPLRAHLSHLLETSRSARKISYWYGARSRQEIFYDDYFRDLAGRHPNFSFHLALSSPLPEDEWTGYTGFIHEAVEEEYLSRHGNPRAIEYYLCGPPMMIKACTRMIEAIGVSAQQIAYDEF
jgi:Na+-transporting NADH:ubiquinone oxidoreductase subunit F